MELTQARGEDRELGNSNKPVRWGCGVDGGGKIKRNQRQEEGAGSLRGLPVGWGLGVWSATPHLSSGKQIIRAMWLWSLEVHQQAPSAPPLVTLSSI